MTDRALLMCAIVEATKKVWSAAARIDHDAERIYLSELTLLIGEYKTLYGDGT